MSDNMVGTIVLTIGCLAIVYATCVIIIQRKVSNIREVNKIRKTINEKQKELSQMIKQNADIKELQAKQQEMMTLLSKTMKYQLKAAFVVLPMFLVVYYAFLPYFISYLGIASTATVFSAASINFTGQSLFLACVFLTGIVLLIITTLYDKMQAKKAENLEPVIKNTY